MQFAMIARLLWTRRPPPPQDYELLWLRVFKHPQEEKTYLLRLLHQLKAYWRATGPIHLVGGPDFSRQVHLCCCASTNLSRDRYIDALSRLADKYRSEAYAVRNLQRLRRSLAVVIRDVERRVRELSAIIRQSHQRLAALKRVRPRSRFLAEISWHLNHGCHPPDAAKSALAPQLFCPGRIA